MFHKYQGHLFELGDKKAVTTKLKELFDKSDDEVKKWLDEFLEAIELDKYINSQDFKFLKLGYRFTHTMRKFDNGIIDIAMFLIDKNGKKITQGYSQIVDGVLDNIFDVTIQKHDVSTAMYQFVDKVGFNKIVGLYSGRGSLNVNYIEFMETYNKTGNKIEAALNTPAGKALKKALKNEFLPNENKIIIDEIAQKVSVEWVKK